MDFSEPELVGASVLLRKFLTLLCAHVADVLPVAASLASCSHQHFVAVSRIIVKDVCGTAHGNFVNVVFCVLAEPV